jgi:hypothetical protein
MPIFSSRNKFSSLPILFYSAIFVAKRRRVDGVWWSFSAYFNLQLAVRPSVWFLAA